MNDVQKILYILNHPIKKEIKEGYTKGWTYYKGRTIKGCHELGFRCPMGMHAADAEKLLPAIIASCGMDAELFDYKGYVMIRLCPNPMPTMIKFNSSMLKGLKPGEILIGYDRIGDRITFNWELPHGIIAGETGMGKSDFIRLIGLCLLRDPDPIDIRIIDLKLLSFLPFRGIPNVTIGTGVDKAYEMLNQVANEVKKRNQLIEKSGSRANTKKLKKIVVIIDEAADISPAAFTKEEKALAVVMENNIATIARLGREVKVHLLYCTQYPTAKVISPQIKINCGMRLGLYVPTAVNSEVVLDKKGAEELGAIPGRAIFKKNKYTTVQIPYVGGDEVWENILKPLKQQGRTDNDGDHKQEGKNPDSSVKHANSQDSTNSKVVSFQQLATKKSKPRPSGSGEGKTNRVELASERKDMEANNQGASEDDERSDDL